MNPGAYCNGITFNANAVITMNPGVYIPSTRVISVSTAERRSPAQASHHPDQQQHRHHDECGGAAALCDNSCNTGTLAHFITVDATYTMPINSYGGLFEDSFTMNRSITVRTQ